MRRHRDARYGLDPAAGMPTPGRGVPMAGVPGKATLVGATPTMALPAALRARLERALATDLSAVRVGEHPEVAELGAKALAQGTQILFAPGAYQPESEAGKQLIAHEVVHLVQQAEGRVAPQGTIDGNVVNVDAGLETEADDLAARALRGEPVKTSGSALTATAPMQGFFGDGGASIANFFQPAPTSAAAAHAQEALAQSQTQGGNYVASANDSDRDARTGLLPFQETAVKQFVVASEQYLADWKAQRGTADLRFTHGEAMANTYAEFRDKLAADPTFVLAWTEASRRLKLGANKQFVREIRLFAPDLLLDHARLVGVADEELKPCHTYELKPVIAGGASHAGNGVKAGFTARRMRVRYTCSAPGIKGLSWEQDVLLNGLVLGFGLGKGASVDVEPPDDYDEAVDQPRRTYLPPDFFAGAEYTRPSMSAGVELGGAKGGAATSSLLISKGGQKLRWDSAWQPDYGASIGDGYGRDDLELEPDADAVIEAGTASLVGDVELHKGKWPAIKYQTENKDERWTPLHMARLYFPTGSADLDMADVKTIGALCEAIYARDKMPGYLGSIFKIEVSGCHSHKWESYDDDLKKYDGKDDSELSESERRKRDELIALKDAENDGLAMSRAINARDAVKTLLGNLEGRMVLGVMAASSLEEPTSHKPIGDDAYSNKFEDRSVLITVSYKLHSATGQVPAPGGVDQSTDNRRQADEMARDD